jgi:hypothetical protein
MGASKHLVMGSPTYHPAQLVKPHSLIPAPGSGEGEHYSQSCAVMGKTRKCANPPSAGRPGEEMILSALQTVRLLLLQVILGS